MFHNYVNFKGKKYIFTQFHFHSSAENRIDNVILPMEIHFVHELKSVAFDPYYRMIRPLPCADRKFYDRACCQKRKTEKQTLFFCCGDLADKTIFACER